MAGWGWSRMVWILKNCQWKNQLNRRVRFPSLPGLSIMVFNRVTCTILMIASIFGIIEAEHDPRPELKSLNSYSLCKRARQFGECFSFLNRWVSMPVSTVFTSCFYLERDKRDISIKVYRTWYSCHLADARPDSGLRGSFHSNFTRIICPVYSFRPVHSHCQMGFQKNGRLGEAE